MRRQFDASIVGERDALGAQALLHHRRRFEVEAAGERSHSIDDAVARDRIRILSLRNRLESPPDRPGRVADAQVPSDVPVRADAARRDLPDHVPDTLEEVLTGLRHGLEGKRCDPLNYQPPLPDPVALASLQIASPADLRLELTTALPDYDAKRFSLNEPLAPYTTFKIGGPADVFFEAHTADELAEVVTAARACSIPFFLLGMGANVLIGDGGVRGLVIRNRAAHVRIEPKTGEVWAESGAIIWPNLIEATLDAGLSGIEHYAGIPSSVGGALWQNLHFLSPPPARERTMFIEEVTESAEILTVTGERCTVDHGWFDFGYDYSTLHITDDIVLSATFRLTPARPEQLREIVEANLEWRGARHPPLDTQPSAGSIFKKIDGVGAGRLADWCGLKGARIGGAMVTERHANILINTGTATARDVRHLIGYIQETVEREQGYRLSTEIGFIGDFGELGPLPPKGWEDADGFAGVP